MNKGNKKKLKVLTLCICMMFCVFMSRDIAHAASKSFRSLPSKISIYSSENYQLLVPNAETDKLTVTSANSNIARVDGNYILGRKNGTTRLTVKNTVTGKSKRITVSVRKMRVLFDGASLAGRAYDNDRNRDYHSNNYAMPVMFRDMMAKEGYAVELGLAIKGSDKRFKGTQLEFYNKFYSKFNKKYDAVVLTPLPAVTFKDRLKSNQDMKGFRKIIRLLIKRNPKVKIYIRHAWTYQNRSQGAFYQDFAVIDNEIATLSREFRRNICTIHDGEAMFYASSQGYPVYSKLDRIHGSVKGMYMATFGVYAAVMDTDPTTLRYNGGFKGVYMTPDEAAAYKQIAKEFCYKR